MRDKILLSAKLKFLIKISSKTIKDSLRSFLRDNVRFINALFIFICTLQINRFAEYERDSG